MRKGSNDHGIVNVLYAAMHMVHFFKSHSLSIENLFGLTYVNALNQTKRYHRTGISKCFENVNINKSFFSNNRVADTGGGGNFHYKGIPLDPFIPLDSFTVFAMECIWIGLFFNFDSSRTYVRTQNHGKPPPPAPWLLI